jgi:MFS family permease
MISLPNRVGDYCCPSEMSQLNLLQTLMYSGYPVGIFLLGVIGGHLGKRTIMLGDMIIVIVGLAILIGNDNLLMGGIGMFLCIFGSNMAEHITIPFITETIS